MTRDQAIEKKRMFVAKLDEANEKEKSCEEKEIGRTLIAAADFIFDILIDAVYK